MFTPARPLRAVPLPYWYRSKITDQAVSKSRVVVDACQIAHRFRNLKLLLLCLLVVVFVVEVNGGKGSSTRGSASLFLFLSLFATAIVLGWI